MSQVQLSERVVTLLQQKQFNTQELVLLADDGGGKYSLHGGACSIGTKFTIVALAQPDPDYPVQLANNAGLHLWTSTYDLMFLTTGVTLDYQKGRITLKDDAHLLDRDVQLAHGAEILAAFKQGVPADNLTC